MPEGTSAVLFVIFNRPDTTEKVFAAIRAARPRRLYVAADSPRRDHPTDAERCDMARRISTIIDWPCELATLFRTTNLGCTKAVSSAIDWFFQHEEEGIILEDDCLPAPDFFPYCGQLLERYRADRRVMAICGSCYVRPEPQLNSSYYFSYFADIWGWATWRRAWQLYDRNSLRWPTFQSRGGLQAMLSGRWWSEEYWSEIFTLIHAGFDSWDLPWAFTVIENGGVACYPVRNLISNIGFRPDATFTKIEVGEPLPALANRQHQNLSFPLVHPIGLSRSDFIEEQIERVRLNVEDLS